MTEHQGRPLVDGEASGDVVVLVEPLSFWGGYDVDRGCIIGRHPQAGLELTGRIVVMPTGRGSSSSSSVLAEAIRAGTGPAAIVLSQPDPVLALGAMVASELYDLVVPVVVVDEAAYEDCLRAARLAVRTGGRVGAGDQPVS